MDLETYVSAGRHVTLERLVRVEDDVPTSDRKRAAIGHRVASIDGEVQESVLELIRIATHEPEGLFDRNIHSDGIADRPAEQFLYCPNQRADIDRPRIHGLSTRKSQEPVCQSSCAIRRRRGAVEESVEIANATLRDASLDKFEGADYTLQKIVEIVRDTAGQLAEGLHFLALSERFFDSHELAGAFLDAPLQRFVHVCQNQGRGLLILDIGIRADPASNFAGIVPNGYCSCDMPSIDPVSAAEPNFGFVTLTGQERLRPQFRRSIEIFRIYDDPPIQMVWRK
ncbi:MAG: hypothetical protein WAL59_25525 [Roseiarcus sp.]